VVVSAVAAAVMAATMTFNSTSKNREFFIETHPHPLPVREGRRYLRGSISFLINNTCFLITPLPHREGQGGESP